MGPVAFRPKRQTYARDEPPSRGELEELRRSLVLHLRLSRQLQHGWDVSVRVELGDLAAEIQEILASLELELGQPVRLQ